MAWQAIEQSRLLRAPKESGLSSRWQAAPCCTIRWEKPLCGGHQRRRPGEAAHRAAPLLATAVYSAFPKGRSRLSQQGERSDYEIEVSGRVSRDRQGPHG